MCSPLAVVGVQTGMGLANEYAKSQYAKAVSKEATNYAEDHAIRAYGALQERQQEEAAAASQAIAKNSREVQLASGAAVTNAAESGAVGGSAAALLQDFERTSLEYEHTVIRNKAFLDAKFKSDAQTVWEQERAEIFNAMPQPPNYMGVLMQGATDALKVQVRQGAQNP